MNHWANFLANEKLTPERVGDRLQDLISLCEKLAETGGPKIREYKLRLESRRKVVNAAMDMGFDLASIKYRGKVAMGRGLLDIWNQEYQKRFGSNIGTVGAKEATRRNVKTEVLRREHERYARSNFRSNESSSTSTPPNAS